MNDMIEKWRKRFSSISELMAYLDQFIARKANLEDGVTGRFWQGRFHCQALLDEKALLTCMMYVDLNPIRAGIAKSLVTSDYTSIAQRIREHQDGKIESKIKKEVLVPKLYPFAAFETKDGLAGIPFDFIQYLELTEWTGSAVRSGKKGTIPEGTPSILYSLGLNKQKWVKQITTYDKRFKGVVGSIEAIRQYSLRTGRRWIQGIKACRDLYQQVDSG